MLSKCTYNSLLKFHVIYIYIYISIVFDGTTHVSEAMVIVRGTLELAMRIESGDLDLSCQCDNY